MLAVNSSHQGKSEEATVCSQQSMKALKTGEDIARSPKQGYQWLNKMVLSPPKFYKKLLKVFILIYLIPSTFETLMLL